MWPVPEINSRSEPPHDLSRSRGKLMGNLGVTNNGPPDRGSSPIPRPKFTLIRKRRPPGNTTMRGTRRGNSHSHKGTLVRVTPRRRVTRVTGRRTTDPWVNNTQSPRRPGSCATRRPTGRHRRTRRLRPLRRGRTTRGHGKNNINH